MDRGVNLLNALKNVYAILRKTALLGPFLLMFLEL